jgi:uncharacterized membrane protein
MSFLKTIGKLGLRIPWKVRAAAFLAYLVFLTWLLLAPATLISRYYPHFQHVDKTIHFLCFGGLVLLARFAFPDPRHLAVPRWLLPVLALAYGAAIEVAQGFLVQYQRAFEWSDIAANGLGAASFWLLSVCLLADGGRRTEDGRLRTED